MWDQASASRLGDSVRRHRLERGLPEETLATLAGITASELELIEAGVVESAKGEPEPSNPRLWTLTALARAMGTTVAELLADAEL
ncbi:helix-turn-helix domain-containing protein [Microbacterium sp. NPDC058389]|uniref:helix-turn-helix domain-containing protein n=1 Tax=Microbacterium sp. NPDC058389 TaxID=3346475 RepID=UPI00365925C5